MERTDGRLKRGNIYRFIGRNYRIISIIGLAYLIILFLIFMSYRVPNSNKYQLGDIARNSIRSDITFLYSDRFEQEKLKKSIEAREPLFYRYLEDHRVVFLSNLTLMATVLTLEDDDMFLKKLRENNFTFSKEAIDILLKERLLLSRYTNRLIYLFDIIDSRYIIIDRLEKNENLNMFEIARQLGIIPVPKEQILIHPLEKAFLTDFIQKSYTGMDEASEMVFAEILINTITPSAVYDPQIRDDFIRMEVNRARNQMIINKGEYLIRRGEIIQQSSLAKILAFFEYKNEEISQKLWVLTALSFLLFIFLIYRFVKFERETFLKRGNIIIALIGLIFVNLCYFLTYFFNEIPFIPIFLYIPFAIISISLPMLLNNVRAAIILLISYSFFGLFYPTLETISFINLIIIALSSIYTSQILKNRNDFFKAALVIGFIEFIFAIIYLHYYQIPYGYREMGLVALFAFGNGFISAIIASGTMPLFETVFNIPTRFRLLELTNPTTSPLLKKLKTEAPGTYNHSLLLGDLCEAAAESIGIDSLLVKAGGYYHDIGKIEIPQYFIENQEGKNKHEEIKVSMSASVIKSHVKLGAELARDYGLPEEVIDYIREHHGTTAISYFYHQAIGLFGDENVNIEDYEYQGPRPRSKGTAILMLADGVEASVRAYFQNNERFTVNIIQDIIDDIFKKRMDKGQFDECDITLFELRQVAEEFFKFLASYYHKRIEYAKK